MRIRLRWAFVIGLALGGWALSMPAEAEEAAPIAVSAGVTYQFLARWDVDRLNKILSVDTPAFADAKVAYTPARNAVKLYRVIYRSVIPEHGNRPTITSGLVAIPDTPEKTLPLVSYQHGTVYGKHEVPSFPEESPETQLMIAQFAGQGYALIGADYFGLGVSTEPESYMVKASHQQATADMVRRPRRHDQGSVPVGLVAGRVRHHGAAREARERRRAGHGGDDRQRAARHLRRAQRLLRFSAQERRVLDPDDRHPVGLLVRELL
jgi:hypothetical protein